MYCGRSGLRFWRDSRGGLLPAGRDLVLTPVGEIQGFATRFVREVAVSAPGFVAADAAPSASTRKRVSQVLARERTAVAVEANPRAISQMPNVSSNNPPGMAPTSPAPATPNSSSRLPAAKQA